MSDQIISNPNSLISVKTRNFAPVLSFYDLTSGQIYYQNLPIDPTKFQLSVSHILVRNKTKLEIPPEYHKCNADDSEKRIFKKIR